MDKKLGEGVQIGCESKPNCMSNASFEFDLIYEPRQITGRTYICRPESDSRKAVGKSAELRDLTTWNCFPFERFSWRFGCVNFVSLTSQWESHFTDISQLINNDRRQECVAYNRPGSNGQVFG